MASAAAAAAVLDQQAVINAFMKSDAVRPTEAIFFEPKGAIQRNFFRNYIKAGIIKPEGERWFLDVPMYNEARRKRRLMAAIAGGSLMVIASIALLL